jgi:hypothetical protein
MEAEDKETDRSALATTLGLVSAEGCNDAATILGSLLQDPTAEFSLRQASLWSLQHVFKGNIELPPLGTLMALASFASGGLEEEYDESRSGETEGRDALRLDALALLILWSLQSRTELSAGWATEEEWKEGRRVCAPRNGGGERRLAQVARDSDSDAVMLNPRMALAQACVQRLEEMIDEVRYRAHTHTHTRQAILPEQATRRAATQEGTTCAGVGAEEPKVADTPSNSCANNKSILGSRIHLQLIQTVCEFLESLLKRTSKTEVLDSEPDASETTPASEVSVEGGDQGMLGGGALTRLGGGVTGGLRTAGECDEDKGIVEEEVCRASVGLEAQGAGVWCLWHLVPAHCR